MKPMVLRGQARWWRRDRGASLSVRMGSLAILLGSGLAFGACSSMGTSTARAAEGEALFEMTCATCHLGGGGRLDAPRTPDLFRDPLQRGETEEALALAIRFGIEPPRMPRFEQGLAPEEIDAIVAYLFAQRAAMRDAN